MRSLALASFLRNQGEEVLLCAPGLSEPLRGKAACYGIDCHTDALARTDDSEAAALAALCRRRGAQWVVLDGYHFQTGYQQHLKDAGLLVLSIDDIAECRYVSDLVVNQNLGAETIFRYECPPTTRLLLGHEFILLRSEFLPHRRSREVPGPCRRVLISLGGGDADNATQRVVETIVSYPQPLEVRVVLGPCNVHGERIRRAASASQGHVEVLDHVADMTPHMVWCDLAIAAAGSTTWELAYLGIPMVIGTIADNQVRVAEQLAARGAAISVGAWQHASSETLRQQIVKVCEDVELRRRLACTAAELCDGQGCRRVREAMRAVERLRGGSAG